MRPKNRSVFWCLAAIGLVIVGVFVFVVGRFGVSISVRKRLLQEFRDDGHVSVSIEERIPKRLRPLVASRLSPQWLEACDRLRGVHFRGDHKSLGRFLPELASVDGVEELVLECREIDASDLSSLPNLADLTTLSIRNQGSPKPEILAKVAACRRLRELDLTGSFANDDEMALILQIKELRSLVLNRGGITDAALETLGRHPHLEKLHLQLTAITDHGLASLSDAKALHDLDISKTRIMDRGLRHVSSLPLRRLEARMTEIRDPGIEHLQALERLEHLDISSNRITDLGFSYLKGLPHLETLDVSSTSITDAGIDESDAFPSLKILTIRFCNLTDESLLRFAHYPALEQLDVTGTRVTPAGVAALRNAKPSLEIIAVDLGEVGE